jgi:hypothetical protein
VRAPASEQGFGVRRPVTIEVRLFLNGEYQTLVERQAMIQGGPNDPELAAAAASAAESLLAPPGPIAPSIPGSVQLPAHDSPSVLPIGISPLLLLGV